jgi:RNase P subunit RPR2
MVEFVWGDKKSEEDESTFCSKCNSQVKLTNFRVTYVGGQQLVEGECPECGSAYLKPSLIPEKYS